MLPELGVWLFGMKLRVCESFTDSETIDGSVITTWKDTNPQSLVKFNASSVVASNNSGPAYIARGLNDIPTLRFTNNGASAIRFLAVDSAFNNNKFGSMTMFVVLTYRSGSGYFIDSSNGAPFIWQPAPPSGAAHPSYYAQQAVAAHPSYYAQQAVPPPPSHRHYPHHGASSSSSSTSSSSKNSHTAPINNNPSPRIVLTIEGNIFDASGRLKPLGDNKWKDTVNGDVFIYYRDEQILQNPITGEHIFVDLSDASNVKYINMETGEIYEWRSASSSSSSTSSSQSANPMNTKSNKNTKKNSNRGEKRKRENENENESGNGSGSKNGNMTKLKKPHTKKNGGNAGNGGGNRSIPSRFAGRLYFGPKK